MNFKWFLKYWFPVILWLGVTFLMSTGTFSASNTSRIIEPLMRFFFPHISEGQLQHVHFLIRKMAHLTEYFVLGLLLFRAFRRGSADAKTWRWAFSSLVAAALFAGVDEFHQSFVSSRTASFIDVGIDTLGGFLAQCVVLVRSRFGKSARRAQ
jgi:VanZ family protein